MRHRFAGRHLARTSAHHKAMRRNLAQSLFQYGQIETTLIKAKEVRPYVERLITLARRGTLAARQRVISILGDRASISHEEQERYEAMSDAQRRRVLTGRSGRRHRAGQVPASYNKKKFPFVAKSVVYQLFTEVAPKFADRPGGFTRIIRLPKRRIGDDSDLALLQLVGWEGKQATGQTKKSAGRRRRKTLDRLAFLEGRKPPKRRAKGGKAAAGASKAPSEPATAEPPASDTHSDAT